METTLLEYGWPGIIIIGLLSALGILASVVTYLYRENRRLTEKLVQSEKEKITIMRDVREEVQTWMNEIMSKTIQSEHETRKVLETMVEGLAAQDLITRYLEKIMQRLARDNRQD